MEAIKHGLNGYRMPSYMEEILTHNYCPYFVRMSMIRDGESYKFTYRPGSMNRLNTDNLDTYNRLMLLRSLISVKEAAEGYLIGAENYLLEPELIYTLGDMMVAGNIRIMFYPDVRKIRFPGKLMQFTDRITEGTGREERELFSQFRDITESGDINRSRMFLDKNILRIEGRSFSKVS